VISRLGVAQYTEIPLGFESMTGNITVTGGAAPARAYIEELLPDILDGTVEPGRVGSGLRSRRRLRRRTGRLPGHGRPDRSEGPDPALTQPRARAGRQFRFSSAGFMFDPVATMSSRTILSWSGVPGSA
jgi:hypothetical protein